MSLFSRIADLFQGGKQAAANLALQAGPAAQYHEFLAEGKWMTVVSSNVELAQYDYESETLYIQYKGGAVYRYDGVTYREALSFAQASSKGKWVWDNLRVRGTKFGHRKPYALTAFH